MSRLALSDTDKVARDWFVETTKSLGCSVTVDAMGNTFAVRPGRRKDVAPIFAGSHLDTQPAAGRYDGILGIHAGIEVCCPKHRDAEFSKAVPTQTSLPWVLQGALKTSYVSTYFMGISGARKADHRHYRC